MLQSIRPHCGVFIYLLVLSYSAILFQDTLCKLYCSVAYTAQVLNASANMWGESSDHHSQDIALLQLEALQKAQAGTPDDPLQPVAQEQTQTLKFFSPLGPAIVAGQLLHNTNFSYAHHCCELAPDILSPPPQQV